MFTLFHVHSSVVGDSFSGILGVDGRPSAVISNYWQDMPLYELESTGIVVYVRYCGSWQSSRGSQYGNICQRLHAQVFTSRQLYESDMRQTAADYFRNCPNPFDVSTIYSCYVRHGAGFLRTLIQGIFGNVFKTYCYYHLKNMLSYRSE